MDEYPDFEVQFPDPEYLRYIEGEHSLSLVVWPTIRPWKVVIWADDLEHWDAPHEGEDLSEADKRRVMANIAEEARRQGVASTIVWEEKPRPLEPPPPREGVLWCALDERGIDLSTSLEDPQHLRHLWALLGREMAREWRLDSLIARERSRFGRGLALEDVAGPTWVTDGEEDVWPEGAWWEAPYKRSPYYIMVAQATLGGIYQVIAHWAPHAGLIMAFRAGEFVTSESLPRIHAAAHDLRLPWGEHGFILSRKQRTFRVFAPPAERAETLEKLGVWVRSRRLRLEVRS